MYGGLVNEDHSVFLRVWVMFPSQVCVLVPCEHAYLKVREADYLELLSRYRCGCSGCCIVRDHWGFGALPGLEFGLVTLLLSLRDID